MKQNVKQIGTPKNFLYQLDRRFAKIDYNIICYRVLILFAIIWLLVLSFKVIGNDLEKTNYSLIPITSLEPIEVEE